MTDDNHDETEAADDETDDHEPEILPEDSWLNRNDPRFGEVVAEENAPTSLKEWASISAKLTKPALRVLLEESDKDHIRYNATVMNAYDHRGKALELADEGVIDTYEYGFTL